MIKLSIPHIPPSSNKLYSSYRGRLVKSKAGREYSDKIEFYALTNKRKIEAARKQVKELLEQSEYLKIECVFVFHFKRVISLKGTLKKIDVSNRVKQAHDATARLLDIDDCHFVEPIIKLATCEDIKNEQVIITITAGQLLRFEDL